MIPLSPSSQKETKKKEWMQMPAVRPSFHPPCWSIFHPGYRIPPSVTPPTPTKYQLPLLQCSDPNNSSHS